MDQQTKAKLEDALKTIQEASKSFPEFPGCSSLTFLTLVMIMQTFIIYFVIYGTVTVSPYDFFAGPIIISKLFTNKTEDDFFRSITTEPCFIKMIDNENKHNITLSIKCSFVWEKMIYEHSINISKFVLKELGFKGKKNNNGDLNTDKQSLDTGHYDTPKEELTIVEDIKTIGDDTNMIFENDEKIANINMVNPLPQDEDGNCQSQEECDINQGIKNEDTANLIVYDQTKDYYESGRIVNFIQRTIKIIKSPKENIKYYLSIIKKMIINKVPFIF